jgi:hypothetical protein
MPEGGPPGVASCANAIPIFLPPLGFLLLCHGFVAIQRTSFLKKPCPECGKAPIFDSLADLLHERKIEMKVVKRVQAQPKDLARHKEVPEIGAGEVPARVTITGGIERPLV